MLFHKCGKSKSFQTKPITAGTKTHLITKLYIISLYKDNSSLFL